MSKPREQTERYWLRLDRETKRMLEKLADLDHEHQSVVFRRLIREEAERRGVK